MRLKLSQLNEIRNIITPKCFSFSNILLDLEA
jgi:hypothetical protein